MESLMQSDSTMTHSYTIQPVVSADGKLAPKLLVVIQEKGGKFDPKTMVGLFVAPNIVVKASKSGKLKKAVLRNFYREVYFPGSVSYLSVVLVDS